MLSRVLSSRITVIPFRPLHANKVSIICRMHAGALLQPSTAGPHERPHRPLRSPLLLDAAARRTAPDTAGISDHHPHHHPRVGREKGMRVGPLLWPWLRSSAEWLPLVKPSILRHVPAAHTFMKRDKTLHPQRPHRPHLCAGLAVCSVSRAAVTRPQGPASLTATESGRER